MGLIVDWESDLRLACASLGARLKDFEAPCDKTGHLCSRVVGRGALPLPRFKGKTPLFARHTRTPQTKGHAR